jgi:hypothetical protein
METFRIKTVSFLYKCISFLKLFTDRVNLFRFLTTSHTHTAWGSAFKKALTTLKSNTESHHEQLFSALELIRFGYLNGNNLSRSYYTPPNVTTGKELYIIYIHIFFYTYFNYIIFIDYIIIKKKKRKNIFS